MKNLMKEPFNAPTGFHPESYEIYHGKPKKTLTDGEVLSLGSRSLQVIHTPGHAPGHVAFYEEETGYLFTGDLLYKGILYANYPSTDPVLFKNSLEKIQGFPIKRILPGHHTLNLEGNLLTLAVEAFQSLEKSGKLVQGNGLFDFGAVQISL